MPRAIILTSHPDEFRAVCAHVTDREEKTHPQGTVYEVGQFSANGETWEVAIAEVTAGNSDAATETERAIAYWKPNVVLSVGVAVGLKDVAAGDVVAGIEVYNHEAGKETASGFSPRLNLGSASYILEQRAKAEAKKEDWLERVGGKEPIWTLKAIVGAIAAGEKEITSSQSELYKLLQSNYGDALAVDVTGYGVLKAVRANPETNALIVRGITHVIDRDVTIDPAQSRRVAAQHASAFAFEILAKLENASSLGLSPAQYAKLKQNLADASKSLLSWKSTLSNGRQIPRPELDELLNRVTTKESSTTIVLGIPGVGKSALMATLGNQAIAQGCAVLAIKADQLNGAINTIEDLQRDLHLELHPSDAIHAVASKERIVVLIDQLDAVSELLDRKSQRLNLLLSLIQRLSGCKNVHIVATCREFEFRYGSRFARLEHIEQLNLSLPAWENIAPILKASEHQPASMGKSLRELLQNPLHLNIFLDVAQPGDIFTSSQKLLDRLWEKRVTEQPEAEKRARFLEKLADRMTEEEVLWLPSAIADTSPEIWRALEQDGLLMTNPENGNIGFRHQTYYDHTLARAFARGSQSLTDIVLERQDGLFVRPILLRGLNYLRGTATQQYQKQLINLLQTFQQRVRPHIRNLLIEFVGTQPHPDSTEAKLLIPLLNSEIEGIKILDATSRSQGWFRRLRDRREFLQWLEKPVEQAVYCSQLLTTAASFAAEDVWDLLEEYWLNDQTYDSLSIRAIRNIGQWTPQRVGLTQQVIQRSTSNWYDVIVIAQRITETLPNDAARVIRTYLDYQLAQALEASKVPPPALPSNADETECWIHAYRHDSLKPLEYLLEGGSNYYEIEKFAEANPQSFLESIWSWFADLIKRLPREAISPIISYRDDRVSDFGFSRSEIIQSLLAAITKLARQDKLAFFKFVRENETSDFLAVHRLLARGLEIVASEEPVKVLDYLLADPRRFSLGIISSRDSHRETKTLIAAIASHLQPHDRKRLEQAILKFNYWQPTNDTTAEFRRKYLRDNRKARLSLLLAIPDRYFTPETKRLKEEEERAFPQVEQRKRNGMRSDQIRSSPDHYQIEGKEKVSSYSYPDEVPAQIVGPRMTKDEMSRATDEALLNLFNELCDETAWDTPRPKQFDNFSRAGGVFQQSDEFGKLVKDDPSWFFRLLPQLKPQRHEYYVGAALESLAKTDFPVNDLISLIEQLDRQGFVSEHFRSNAASALEKTAERYQGLPQSVLSLLASWLPQHSQPALAHYRSEDNLNSSLQSPILVGSGCSHFLPSGRGSIVRALAEGYLRQDPPDLKGWAEFIDSQLGVESHPAVWVDVLSRMLPLLNGDRAEATQLFERVIRNCPQVLEYAWTLYFISHTIGWFEPKETVQGWLELLRANNSNFSQQAYGEMLLVQYFQYQDEWSVNRIRAHLAHRDNEALVCGLAHAVSYLWDQRRCRAIATEILYTLASSSTPSIQHAVASVFRSHRDRFKLDCRMLKIIRAVCKNPGVLFDAARNLIAIIETEELVDNNPEIVVEVCQSLLGIGAESANPERSVGFMAESLTTIAIELHRQPLYREKGLQIFEKLIALNLRETRSALEILDRKPHR